ncbi:two-component response regulator [Bacillus sp. JCM 19046]|nr:two-component response regulator [Bacillus sp. JCM 19045]GAF17366.1 two-component response regulator [Bacillus sp. JCM 19046]
MSDKVTRPHILIIEDDEHINQIIYDMLKQEGFLCTQAFSGTEGKLHVTNHSYQLILLDLMLPGLSGDEFMVELRQNLHSDTPVIVLSSREKLDHKLALFDLGADDYVTKPFDLAELLARIQVHIRRKQFDTSSFYQHKALTMNNDTLSVAINQTPLTVTRREYKIMEMFLRNPTRVFTKQDLYELAWDEPYLGEDKTITVHISNIRHKIKTLTEEPYIDTVWGIGFRLNP